MGELVNRRRRGIAGIVSMVVGAACLVWALAGTAGATHVNPTEVAGNATCPAGTTAFTIQDPADGTFDDGTLFVTIDVRDTAEGQVFDFTSNIGVDVVIVKGGNASNVYTYDPPTESTGDTGLHAPANPSGEFAGLSHITFCYDVEAPTTTTSTTVVPTTTTSTTEKPTTTSTTEAAVVAPSTTTTSPAAVPVGQLPRTGSGSQTLLLVAGITLLLGGAALAASAKLGQKPLAEA